MVSTQKKKQQNRKLSCQLDGFDHDANNSKSARSERQDVEVRRGQGDPEFTGDNNGSTALASPNTLDFQTSEESLTSRIAGKWVMLLIRLRIEFRMPLRQP